MASSSSIINTLARPEHQKIWKEVSDAAAKDGIDVDSIKKISPYVFVAMEKLRKTLTYRPSSNPSKRGPEAAKDEPKPKKKAAPSSKPPPAQQAKPVADTKDEKNERKGNEGKTKKKLSKEFNGLKDYNLIIVGIPTIEVEESPKLKVIKLPFVSPEKLTATLKETSGWEKVNHSVIVIPRGWSAIEGADDAIYNLMDALEQLSPTLELSFLAPPVDDKTPAEILQFINRIKNKMILHDLPEAKFQRGGRLCQKWYADAIKDYLNLIMKKEEERKNGDVSDISMEA